MCRDKTLFKKIELISGNIVTFGDGSKSIVEGKYSIEILELPIIQNVLFVSDFKANLLSISQFYDDNFFCTVIKV